MRAIPLNALTLYADLHQSAGDETIAPATISRRLESGYRRLYAKIREGVKVRQVYLGSAGEAAAEAKAASHRLAMARALERRRTVSALKRLHIPAPSRDVGRVIEALSRAGIFREGGVLVGTAAYQCYPCLVGYVLPNQNLITRDVDFSIARVAVPRLAQVKLGLEAILQQADPTFRADMKGEKADQSIKNSSGFVVDVLTTSGRSDGPLLIKSLGVYATPLPFMDFLVSEPVAATALYGSGVPVMLPDPFRFACHKLVIARRRIAQKQKVPKDLAQAWSLIDALLEFDPEALEAGLDEAEQRRGDVMRAAKEIRAYISTNLGGDDR